MFSIGLVLWREPITAAVIGYAPELAVLIIAIRQWRQRAKQESRKATRRLSQQACAGVP